MIRQSMPSGSTGGVSNSQARIKPALQRIGFEAIP